MIDSKLLPSIPHLNLISLKNAVGLLKGRTVIVLGLTAISLFALKWIYSRVLATKLLPTKGHFLYENYSKHFDGALGVLRKYYSRVVDPKANNRWEWIYLSQKEEIFKSADLKETEGTCFGNCCALGKEIIRNGKILSAKELQKIEQGDKFPKRAMGFQMIQNANRNICKRVDSAYKTPFFERPSDLSEEEKSILGKKAPYFCYQRHLDCLKSYNLSFKDVADLSPQNFGKIIHPLIMLFDASFEFVRDEILKNPDLKSGKELIEWIAKNGGLPESYALPNPKDVLRPAGNPLDIHQTLIFPKISNVESLEHFYLCEKKLEKSLLFEQCEAAAESDFAGFFIITGSTVKGDFAGHALLLEIDNKTKNYVLYDNNLGFYQGNDLEDCLNILNFLLNRYKYEIRTFYPYVFKTAE